MRRLPIPDRKVTITGYLLPIYDEDELSIAPVLFEIDGVKYITLFSTEEKLREACVKGNVTDPYRIKQITDGREFFSSIVGYSVIVDPWINESGNTRFTLLTPTDS